MTFLIPLDLDLSGVLKHSEMAHLLTSALDRPAHMRRLYEICQSPTKVWKPLPRGDHNTSVLEEGYFEAITEFIGNLAQKR
jgi:hypothetical protein